MVEKGETRGYYIPRVWELPHGFVIRTMQLSPTAMKAKHGADYDGIWDSDMRSIDIKKSISKERKWYVYSHELLHAVNDWQHWLINRGIAVG